MNKDAMSKDSEGSKEFFEFIAKIAFRGTSDLRKHLKVDETNFRFSMPYAQQLSKDVYLYRVLDEVQKAGVSIQMWQGYLSEGASEQKAEGQLERVLFESVIDDQSFRTRKLVETLVDMICFGTTASEIYFRDFFLLKELDEYIRAQQDREEFYAFKSRNNSFGMDFTKSEITKLEQTGLEPAKRWYLRTPEALKEKWLEKGVPFSSFRSRYMLAIKKCLPSELAVLGKSYIHAYGMSKDVHFSADDNSYDFHPDEAWQGMSHVGMLCMSLVVRCQIELNLVPEGINKQLRDLHDSNTTPQNLVDDLKADKGAVGDFVWAWGDLAEIMEAKISNYGYRCYRVKYLNQPPITSIPEDWFAGFQIKQFLSRKRVEALLDRMTSGTDFPEETRKLISSTLPKDRKAALYDFVKSAWKVRHKVSAAAKLSKATPPPPAN